METPSLPEDGDGRRFRLEVGLDVPAVFGTEPRLAGAPEGGQPGVVGGDFLGHLEEAGVLGVGARPSPIDVALNQCHGLTSRERYILLDILYGLANV